MISPIKKVAKVGILNIHKYDYGVHQKQTCKSSEDTQVARVGSVWKKFWPGKLLVEKFGPAISFINLCAELDKIFFFFWPSLPPANWVKKAWAHKFAIDFFAELDNIN